MKNSLVIYYDILEQLEDFTDEQFGHLLRAVIKFDMTGQEPKFTGEMKVAFKCMKPILIKNKEDYEQKCQKNRENVLKRWKNTKHTNEYNRIPNIRMNTNDTDNDNDNVNVNDNERDNDDFATSLSQRFPNIGQDVCVENFFGDKDKLFKEIEKSNFLKSANLSFIIDNYDKVLSGKYATFKPQKESGMATHHYSKEQVNNTFDDLDQIEIS